MKLLKEIWTFFCDELKLILHNRSIIMVLLISPIFYALFYASIYGNKSNIDLPIAIVDYDHTELSRELILDIDSSPKISVTKVCSSIDDAQTKLELQEVLAVAVIEKNFSTKITKEEPSNFQLYLNNSRFLVSNDISKSISEVILFVNRNILVEYYLRKGLAFPYAQKSAEPINIDIRNLFNTTESYGDFLIPAILLLILHQTLMIGVTESFLLNEEKKLLPLSNISIIIFLFVRLMFYLLLYVAYTLLFFSVIVDIFEIPFAGNLLDLLLNSIFAIASTFFLSIIIASFFKSRINVFRIITISSYPIFLISGFSWPNIAIPEFIKYLALFIPYTSFSEASIKFIQLGGNLSSALPQVLNLVALTIIYFLVAYRRLKLQTSKNKGV